MSPRAAAGPSDQVAGGGVVSSPATGATAERAARTREAVLRAAALVFDRVGYSAATVDQIAAEAKVTKGAVYFHFASKGALAQAVVAQQHASWAALAEEAAGWQLDGLNTLERLIGEVARTYFSNPLMPAGVRLANEEGVIETEIAAPFVGWMLRLTGILRAGQADGSVRRDLDCEVTARILVGSFYGIEEISSRLTDRADLEETVARWWLLVRPGLAG